MMMMLMMMNVMMMMIKGRKLSVGWTAAWNGQSSSDRASPLGCKVHCHHYHFHCNNHQKHDDHISTEPLHLVARYIIFHPNYGNDVFLKYQQLTINNEPSTISNHNKQSTIDKHNHEVSTYSTDFCCLPIVKIRGQECMTMVEPVLLWWTKSIHDDDYQSNHGMICQFYHKASFQ